MKKIMMEPGYGKTYQLIKMSAETRNYIVCNSKKECSRIHAMSLEMGLSIPFPISYEEFLGKEYYGKRIRGFLIDNVDDLLESISTVRINAITMRP